MLKLVSNLSRVIENLERVETEVPLMIRRAIAPAAWLQPLERDARQVLKALAAGEPDEQRRAVLLAHVETAVASLAGAVTADGSRYTLHMTGAPSGFGLQYNLPGTGAGLVDRWDVPPDLLADFKQKIYEWVSTEKDWDIRRDGEKTIENIADKTEWIADLLTTHRPLEALEQDARDAFSRPAERGNGLFEALTSGSAGADSPLDADTARAWAAAVLEIWRDLAVTLLPRNLKKELKTLKALMRK